MVSPASQNSLSAMADDVSTAAKEPSSCFLNETKTGDIEQQTKQRVTGDDSVAEVECKEDVGANIPNTCGSTAVPPLRGLSFLDRFLVIWIFLAMVLGITLGNTVPSIGSTIEKGEFVGVCVPIAIGLLIMMYPILAKVRFETLPRLFRTAQLWRHLLFSIIINWIFCPLLMLGLAWAFLPDRADLRAGLVWVGCARCIAMVLIWNELAGGDGDFCALLVAVNALLQIALYAPLAVAYTRLANLSSSSSSSSPSAVPYPLAARSVAVFLGIPLLAAALTRLTLLPLLGPEKYASHFLRFVAPLSLLGLLYTIVVLFASQAAHVTAQIVSVVRVAAPLCIYFPVVFIGTLALCRMRVGPSAKGCGYPLATAQAFTAASNNFELAIAVTVAVYGQGSGEALASTVGPLVEVPMLVGLVYVLRWWVSRQSK